MYGIVEGDETSGTETCHGMALTGSPYALHLRQLQFLTLVLIFISDRKHPTLPVIVRGMVTFEDVEVRVLRGADAVIIVNPYTLPFLDSDRDFLISIFRSSTMEDVKKTVFWR